MPREGERNLEQQELSSDARRRGETSNATETFAYLGIHAGEAFVGTLQDPGLLHVNTRHCLEKRLREQQRAGGRDIVNASRCARPEYLRLAIAGI